MRVLPRVDVGAVVADFGTELVVLAPRERRAHHLDALWSVVFDSCRQGHSFERLVDDIDAASSWPRDETTRWVDQAVTALEAAGLLTV